MCGLCRGGGSGLPGLAAATSTPPPGSRSKGWHLPVCLQGVHLHLLVAVLMLAEGIVTGGGIWLVTWGRASPRPLSLTPAIVVGTYCVPWRVAVRFPLGMPVGDTRAIQARHCDSSLCSAQSHRVVAQSSPLSSRGATVLLPGREQVPQDPPAIPALAGRCGPPHCPSVGLPGALLPHPLLLHYCVLH